MTFHSNPSIAIISVQEGQRISYGWNFFCVAMRLIEKKKNGIGSCWKDLSRCPIVKNFLKRQEFLATSKNSCLSEIFLSFQDFLVFPRFSWLSKIFLIFQEYLDTSSFTSVVKNFLQSREILVFPRFFCLSKIFLTFQDFPPFCQWPILPAETGNSSWSSYNISFKI